VQWLQHRYGDLLLLLLLHEQKFACSNHVEITNMWRELSMCDINVGGVSHIDTSPHIYIHTHTQTHFSSNGNLYLAMITTTLPASQLHNYFHIFPEMPSQPALGILNADGRHKREYQYFSGLVLPSVQQ
jgi:hypothetical protein